MRGATEVYAVGPVTAERLLPFARRVCSHDFTSPEGQLFSQCKYSNTCCS